MSLENFKIYKNLYSFCFVTGGVSENGVLFVLVKGCGVCGSHLSILGGGGRRVATRPILDIYHQVRDNLSMVRDNHIH